jgi:hypothetical protein
LPIGRGGGGGGGRTSFILPSMVTETWQKFSEGTQIHN